MAEDKCPEGGEHDWSDWSYAVYPAGRRMCKKCYKTESD